MHETISIKSFRKLPLLLSNKLELFKSKECWNSLVNDSIVLAGLGKGATFESKMSRKDGG